METIQSQKNLPQQRGQSLVEYLIIVAIVAIGTIGIVRVLGATMSVKFAQIANALQGKENHVESVSIRKTDYAKKDLGDFMQDSSKKDNVATSAQANAQ